MFLRSSVEYASPVWHGSIREVDATTLERIQCSVARLVLQAARDTPKKKLLEDVGWPSLSRRREILSMVLFVNLLDIRPPALMDCISLLIKYQVAHREHRKPYQLVLPKIQSSNHLNSFVFRCSVLWNTLPHGIHVTA